MSKEAEHDADDVRNKAKLQAMADEFEQNRVTMTELDALLNKLQFELSSAQQSLVNVQIAKEQELAVIFSSHQLQIQSLTDEITLLRAHISA